MIQQNVFRCSTLVLEHPKLCQILSNLYSTLIQFYSNKSQHNDVKAGYPNLRVQKWLFAHKMLNIDQSLIKLGQTISLVKRKLLVAMVTMLVTMATKSKKFNFFHIHSKKSSSFWPGRWMFFWCEIASGSVVLEKSILLIASPLLISVAMATLITWTIF